MSVRPSMCLCVSASMHNCENAPKLLYHLTDLREIFKVNITPRK